MNDFLSTLRSFLRELKRRSVFRVAVVYAIVAWVVVQVAALTFPALHLPPWTVTLVVVLALSGFPIALVLAWAFEVTPKGVRRTEPLAPTARPQKKIEVPRRQPPSPEPHFAHPLVGRERELGLLQQRVDTAVQGEGSLVFITGEAGIGKTRLAWEVRPYARERGFLWLEGHYFKEGSILFQPWVEAIRAFLGSAPPAMLEKVLAAHVAELVRLVPEVAERMGTVPSLPSIGPEEERIRLFDALTGFFIAISQEQPLALFLDDLQWAPTLDTLHHMARSVSAERLLLLGAYRDAELKEKPILAKTVLALNRERLFQPLALKRLGEAEVAQMMAQTLGEEASTSLVEIVNQKTEGNPFFVEEVVRYLIESEGTVPGENRWEVQDPAMIQLPDSVKAIVGERLERLEEDARSALTRASVLGKEFTLPLLEEVTELQEDRLLEVVDKAVAARVLTPRPSLGREVYTFVDHQTRDVLYEGIGPARRRRYHLKAGQAIEKVQGRHPEEYYDALAHHFLEGNELEKAAAYSAKAGDRASTIYAWGRAMAHYQTALELLEELEAGPRQQAEVLEKLALASMFFGRGKSALGYWEKALSLYETLGDAKKAGAVHLRLAQQYHTQSMGTRDPEKAYTHSAKAITLLEPTGGNVELAQAYTRFGYIAAHRNEPLSTGIAPLEKGLALAQRLGDAAGVGEAAMSLGHVLVYHAGEVKGGLELAHEGYESAKRSGDTVLLAEAALRLSEPYLILRDADCALRWAEEAVEVSRQSGAIRAQIQSSLLLGWASILRGDTARAVLSLETAQQAAKKAGVEVSQVSRPPLLALAMVPFFLGDWDKVENGLLKCIESSKQAHHQVLPILTAWASGWLYLERGDLVGAKAQLCEAVTICEARGEKTSEVAPLALLVEIASKSGELEEALAHLSRARKIVSQTQEWRGLAGEVHLASGILATAEKQWEEANDAFQNAVEINRQYHLPYYEAKSLFEWCQMHISRNGPGDQERGMELLDQSLDIFQRIQATKMVEKVMARKQVLGA